MRFSAMRRMASLTLALVWGAARLAQPLQPECPHHAVTAAAAAQETPAATNPHTHHHAMAGDAVPASAAPAEHPASHHPGNSSAPCECAAHCCAASTVAVAPTVESLIATIAPPSRVIVVPLQASAPRARLSVRQPPATAPPTSDVV
jgi:hypothetical protein